MAEIHNEPPSTSCTRNNYDKNLNLHDRDPALIFLLSQDRDERARNGWKEGVKVGEGTVGGRGKRHGFQW